MANSIKQVGLLLAALFFCNDLLIATENTGRFLPFSSRPEKFWYKKEPTLDVDFFYASGHNVANEDAAPIGMGEVMGRYDLQQILFAMDQANLPTQEVKDLIGAQYAARPLIFDVHGKLRSGGMALRYAWPLPCQVPLTVGINVPLAYTESYFRYSLDQRNFIQQYVITTPARPLSYITGPDEATWQFYQERLDHARRVAHEVMGFTSNDWTGVSIGDTDLFVRSNFVIDHRFLMRTIDIAVQYGLMVPTGVQRANDEPSSIAFMNDGHWAFYAQFVPTFELKQDLKVGFMLRGQHFFPQTRERRLPVFKESVLFTPLKGFVRVQQGSTFIGSAFLVLENLYDGLHLQGRYTYKRHQSDEWTDVRQDKTIPSYLSRTETAAGGIQPAITDDEIKKVISAKEYLSKFRSHYITIQLTYDPLEAQQELLLKPKFFASFEAPMFDASRGIVQANQITVGAELHF